ncbi:MAG: hypothetical protein ABSE51_12120 [Terracidiphilus sp.]|jgi:hypothetical protein
MLSTQKLRKVALALFVLAVFILPSTRSSAQAALLMEEPYGFFGSVNPTGHNAIYFERICAETPVKLRRCQAGELGSVIARYQGIDGYDWVAMPLVPYLYSVEKSSDVPVRVDHEIVNRLRDRYREAHLLDLGADLYPGNVLRGGWTQLVGVSYERRIYAFRFETSEEQDDALIASMNDSKNRTHFNLLFNNCSDFARVLLNFYFPRTFKRSVFPDAGMTTPKQLAYKLERYARKHPETQLTIFEIPQIPGYRRRSHSNKSIDESLTTTVYAIPIALANPYLAGGLFVDYLVRGRYHLIPKNLQLLTPDNLQALTAPARAAENPLSVGAQVPSAAASGSAEAKPTATATSGLKEIRVAHE